MLGNTAAPSTHHHSGASTEERALKILVNESQNKYIFPSFVVPMVVECIQMGQLENNSHDLLYVFSKDWWA